MASNSLYDLLKGSLSRLYAAEQEMLRVLPRVAEDVSCCELREALLCYVGETERRAKRLESAAGILSSPVSSTTCSGIAGLIRDLMNTAEEQGEAGIIDVALIAVLRRIEFCEISSYETARSIAEALGEEEVLKILEENLREEEVMERFLTVLSEELIDDQSLSGGASREPSYSVAGAHNGTSREGRGAALTQAT